MNIGVYTNLNKDPSASTAKQFIHLLQERNIGFKFFADKKLESDTHVKLCDLTDDIDFLVAFGGDGTMLNIVPYCARKNIPILGVNMGHIGFLTESDTANMEECLDKLIAEDYFCETRSMLSVMCGDYKYIALNEVVLAKSCNSNICNIAVDIDDVRADKVRADGVMVCTPTGSTGYSLSCNGSILSPDLNAFIINAICPHSLHFCPIVVSDASTVTLSCDNENMRLTVDGKVVFDDIDDPGRVVIRKSKYCATLVRFEKQRFYTKLIKKLAYWGE